MSNKSFKAYDLNNNLVSISGYSSTRFVVGPGDECPYSSIQAAINDAATLAIDEQQVVLVRHGFYKEDLIFKPNVSVIGIDSPGMLDVSNYIPAGFPEAQSPAASSGVWIEGTHEIKQDSGFGQREVNIKNLTFIPKDYSSFGSVALNKDIITFSGSGGNASNFNFENCRFFSGTYNFTGDGFSGKVIASGDIDNPGNYEGDLIVFKDCFFNLAYKDPSVNPYSFIDLVGANGTKYIFNDCMFTCPQNTHQMIIVYDAGLGDTWYTEFKNCKMENVFIFPGGGGSGEANIKIENCQIETNSPYGFANFFDVTGPFEIINSNITAKNTTSLFSGDYPSTFNTRGTSFTNLSGDTTPEWIYDVVDSEWQNEANNTIVGSSPVYGVFTSVKSQSADLNIDNEPIATAAEFETNEEQYGIRVEQDSIDANRYTKISFDYPGVYNIAFSFQLDRVSGSGTADVNIWLRKNGVDVPRSDTKITISGPASSAKTVAAWNFVSKTASTDYYQIMWAPTDEHIQLVQVPYSNTPGQVRPEIPSTILTVWKL